MPLALPFILFSVTIYMLPLPFLECCDNFCILLLYEWISLQLHALSSCQTRKVSDHQLSSQEFGGTQWEEVFLANSKSIATQQTPQHFNKTYFSQNRELDCFGCWRKAYCRLSIVTESDEAESQNVDRMTGWERFKICWKRQSVRTNSTGIWNLKNFNCLNAIRLICSAGQLWRLRQLCMWKKPKRLPWSTDVCRSHRSNGKNRELRTGVSYK